MSRVSIVIPVKDDAAMLTRCLAALAKQSVIPHEIIVVDNASRDASAAVAANAGVRVIREDRPGIPAASAAGYDACEGEVIGRLDADSVPAPDWVERLVLAFDAEPGVAAITGGAAFIDGPRMLRSVLARLYLGAYVLTLAPVLGHVPLFGSNMAMRATAWRAVSDAVHREDAEVHDDLDLSFHLGLCARVRWVRCLHVGISPRPFSGPRDIGRRIRRGAHTVVVHRLDELPPLRWHRRVRGVR